MQHKNIGGYVVYGV